MKYSSEIKRLLLVLLASTIIGLIVFFIFIKIPELYARSDAMTKMLNGDFTIKKFDDNKTSLIVVSKETKCNPSFFNASIVCNSKNLSLGISDGKTYTPISTSKEAELNIKSYNVTKNSDKFSVNASISIKNIKTEELALIDLFSIRDKSSQLSSENLEKAKKIVKELSLINMYLSVNAKNDVISTYDASVSTNHFEYSSNGKGIYKTDINDSISENNISKDIADEIGYSSINIKLPKNDLILKEAEEKFEKKDMLVKSLTYQLYLLNTVTGNPHELNKFLFKQDIDKTLSNDEFNIMIKDYIPRIIQYNKWYPLTSMYKMWEHEYVNEKDNSLEVSTKAEKYFPLLKSAYIANISAKLFDKNYKDAIDVKTTFK